MPMKINCNVRLQDLSQDRSNFPEVICSTELVPYEIADEFMRARVQEIIQGTKPELLWFLEHPPLLTLGTSAKAEDIGRSSLPAYKTGRGGQVTYHGPGQRVVYVMLDLRKRGPDLRQYIQNLEAWMISTLKDFDVIAERREGRVGLWVPRVTTTSKVAFPVEDKIAAIGVRISKWVTAHGISINVCPDLKVYEQFTPCGIKEHGVTSLEKLGKKVSIADLDQALLKNFAQFFPAP